MNFEHRHRYPRPVDVVWQTLFSPAYEAAMQQETGITRELLEDRQAGAIRRRRTRMTSAAELPAVAQSVVGAKKLSYELIEEINEADFAVRWEVKPDRIGDKVEARGSYRFAEAPGGAERTMLGTVTVRVPLVGGRIESAVAEELRAGYDKAHAFATRWLLERT